MIFSRVASLVPVSLSCSCCCLKLYSGPSMTLVRATLRARIPLRPAATKPFSTSASSSSTTTPPYNPPSPYPNTPFKPHPHSLPVQGFVGAVGNTPLVSPPFLFPHLPTLTVSSPQIRINSLSEETGCEILGKAEFMNPGGSVKDRAALGLVKWAENTGTCSTHASANSCTHSRPSNLRHAC